MSAERTLIVAVEDTSTAGIVAVEAAHVAMEADVGNLVLLHVLDAHPLMGAVAAACGYCIPTAETADEAERVFAMAEYALCAECAAMGRSAPTIERAVAEGDVGAAIEEAAKAHAAVGVVLGARRPHAFGRLVHPDVRAHLESRAPCRLHVAALQAAPSGH